MVDSTAWVTSSPRYAEGDELIPKAFIGLRKEGGRMPAFYRWPVGRRSTRPGAEPQATRRLGIVRSGQSGIIHSFPHPTPTPPPQRLFCRSRVDSSASFKIAGDHGTDI